MVKLIEMMECSDMKKLDFCLSKSKEYRNSSKRNYQFTHIALHFSEKCNELV